MKILHGYLLGCFIVGSNEQKDKGMILCVIMSSWVGQALHLIKNVLLKDISQWHQWVSN